MVQLISTETILRGHQAGAHTGAHLYCIQGVGEA